MSQFPAPAARGSNNRHDTDHQHLSTHHCQLLSSVLLQISQRLPSRSGNLENLKDTEAKFIFKHCVFLDLCINLQTDAFTLDASCAASV